MTIILEVANLKSNPLNGFVDLNKAAFTFDEYKDDANYSFDI